MKIQPTKKQTYYLYPIYKQILKYGIILNMFSSEIDSSYIPTDREC